MNRPRSIGTDVSGPMGVCCILWKGGGVVRIYSEGKTIWEERIMDAGIVRPIFQNSTLLIYKYKSFLNKRQVFTTRPFMLDLWQLVVLYAAFRARMACK